MSTIFPGRCAKSPKPSRANHSYAMGISLFVDASYNSLTTVNLFLYQRAKAAAVPLLSARGGPLESVFLANSRSYDSGKKGKVMRKAGACASGHHAPLCSTSTVCAGGHHAAPFSLTPLPQRPATRPSPTSITVASPPPQFEGAVEGRVVSLPCPPWVVHSLGV